MMLIGWFYPKAPRQCCMSISDTAPLRRLGKWGGPIFLIAGGLLLITAIGLAVEVVTGMSLQGPIIGVPQFAGLLISYIGLLGLYSLVRDRSPRLALIGIVLILGPVIAILVFIGYEVTVGGEPPFVDTIFMVIGVGFALGIALLGIASLRAETLSRDIGISLLVLAVPFLLLVVLGAENSAIIDFVISGLTAGALLAIGYLLQWRNVTT